MFHFDYTAYIKMSSTFCVFWKSIGLALCGCGVWQFFFHFFHHCWSLWGSLHLFESVFIFYIFLAKYFLEKCIYLQNSERSSQFLNLLCHLWLSCFHIQCIVFFTCLFSQWFLNIMFFKKSDFWFICQL